MKVVIMEFVEDFKVFSQLIEKENLSIKDFKIIALESKLQAYLNLSNIKYEDTLQYFNNDSQKNTIVESEKVMLRLRSEFTFTDSNGLKNCYNTEFNTFARTYTNYIIKIIEILDNVVKRNKAVEFYSPKYSRYYNSRLLDNKESYLGLLVERFSKLHNLKFVDIASANENDLRDSGIISKSTNIRKLFTRLLIFFLKGKKVVFTPVPGAMFGKVVKDVKSRYSGITFAAMSDKISFWKMFLYNVWTFAKSMFNENIYQFYVFNPNNIEFGVDEDEKIKITKEVDRILGVSDTELCKYKGIEYNDIFANKVNCGLKNHMVWLLELSYNIGYALKTIKKSAVVTFNGQNLFAVAGELARVTGRKSLFVSHGAHPVPVDEYHEIELFNIGKLFMLGDFTDIALSTPIQEEHLHYFKNKYADIKSNEIITGPLIFANINLDDRKKARKALGFSDNEFVILHATTHKNRMSERYQFVETFDEFFNSLSDVIRVVDELSDAKLILRLHPGFILDNNEFKSFLPRLKKCIISRKGQFADVLSAADLLISYSSTAIDEALINKIPVLLYDKWKRYNHFGTGVFENSESKNIFPVCYVNDPNNLKNAVNFIRDSIKLKQKNEMDVGRYRYEKNYYKNFLSFFEDI
ncbi:MAG: hypothetical protein ABII27_08025 [bacterium]